MKPQTPNTENKEIFHDWMPRELEALKRATAWLRAMQPPAEPPRYATKRRIINTRNNIVRNKQP